MTTLYQKKNYTQGFLRAKIKEKKDQGKTYQAIKQELGIGSDRTIAKRSLSTSIESKSSAPLNPFTKYGLTELINLYCVRKYLTLNLDETVDYLKEHYNTQIPRSTAGYRNKQRKLSVPEKQKNGKFKEYDPGFLHIDITYGPKIKGKKYYIFVAIDRATRLMYLEIYEDKTAESTKKFLENVIERYPFKIEKILTDNGREFTLKNHKGKVDLIGLFDEVCIEFGIEHRLTKPYTPKTNGMVEKCNDTIKENTVKIHNYEDIEKMKDDLNKFMIYYNLYRRHGGVIKENKGKTPMDALHYYYKLMPEIFKYPIEEFEEKIKQEAIKYNITKHTNPKLSS